MQTSLFEAPAVPVYSMADVARGQALRSLRYELAPSPSEASKRLGLTVQQLSDAEAGKYLFDLDNAQKLLARPL
jgi:hypothetical protein